MRDGRRYAWAACTPTLAQRRSVRVWHPKVLVMVDLPVDVVVVLEQEKRA